MKQKKIREIIELLKITSTHSILRSSLIAGRLGINTTDLECVEVLIRLGKTTAGALSVEMKLTTGAVTKMLDRLEKAALVERLYDKKDRRKVFIALKMDILDQKVFPLYRSLSDSVNAQLLKYTGAHLDMIIEFLTVSLKISEEDLKMLAEK